jgi:hypothetical protein
MDEMASNRYRFRLSGLLWLALVCLVAWAYWPGLQGPLLLDDFANLVTLEKLELQEDFSADIVVGNTSGPLGRPIAMASFVLESLYFDNGVAGQKRFGLLLHLINGCLTLLLCMRLLRASHVQRPLFFAVLAAGLWLSAPLLLSTTLYVVQRMTLLAAMFSLLALCAYCLARDRQLEGGRSLHWLLLAFASTICAVLSKENGVLTLPMMTAIEVFIYSFKVRKDGPLRRLQGVHAAILLLPVLGLAAVFFLRPELVLDSYEFREFSFSQRLLTEARILWMYLAQLLWPNVHTLGLYQDDVLISTALTRPISTLFAVAGWSLMLLGILASALWRRGRLLAFGVSFFLVGHALESSIFSLELYFEHRNYLPSLGIWFALIAVLAQLQQRWPQLRDWLLLALAAILLRNIVLLGSQAVFWSDERLIHMEAANYHPNSERAQLELAHRYSLDGNLDAALAILEGSSGVSEQGRLKSVLLQYLFYCMAQQTPPGGLLSGFSVSQAELSDIGISDHIYQLARIFVDEECPAGSSVQLADQIRLLLTNGKELRGSRKIYGAMILLENHNQSYESGMQYVQLLLEREPDSVMALQFMLYFASVLELEKERAQALSRLQSLDDRGLLNRQEAYNLELFLKP